MKPPANLALRSPVLVGRVRVEKRHEQSLGEVVLLLGRMVNETVKNWGESASLIAGSGAIQQICGLSEPHVAPRPRLHALWALANITKYVLVAVPRLMSCPKGTDGCTGLQRVVALVGNKEAEMLSRVQGARALVNIARYPMAKYGVEMHEAGGRLGEPHRHGNHTHTCSVALRCGRTTPHLFPYTISAVVGPETTLCT